MQLFYLAGDYDPDYERNIQQQLKENYLTIYPLLMFQTFPFFGVEPTILNEHGEELEGEGEGYLVSINSIICTFIYPRGGNCVQQLAGQNNRYTQLTALFV